MSLPVKVSGDSPVLYDVLGLCIGALLGMILHEPLSKRRCPTLRPGTTPVIGEGRTLAVRFLVAGLLILMLGRCSTTRSHFDTSPLQPVEEDLAPAASLQTPEPTIPAPTATPLDPWSADLVFLAETLKNSGYFSATSALDSTVSDLLVDFRALNEQEKIVAYVRIANLGTGGNFTVNWDELPHGFARIYPFRLNWFDQGLFVSEATPDHAELLGTRLVYVGETEIRDAAAEITDLVSSEGRYAQVPAYLTNPAVLYGLGLLPEMDAGLFVFEDVEGNQQSVRLPAGSSEDVEWISPPRDFYPSPLPRAANYWFTYLRDERTLYLQYNLCEPLYGLAFEDLLADLLYVSRTEETSRLIVDLRNNPGGRQELNQLLVSAVCEFRSINPEAQVFVLVGPETLGAALHGAIDMRNSTGATIVSSPDWTDSHFSANFESIVLPHSGLEILIRTEQFEPDLTLLPRVDAHSDPLVEAVAAVSSTMVLSDSGTSCVAPPGEVSGVARSARWRRDLHALREEIAKLPEIHEGEFAIVEGAAFQAAVSVLDEAIPSLEDHKVVVGMMQLLVQLGDAHTRLSYLGWEAFDQIAYPVQVKWFSDGLYVTAVQPGHEELLALEVTRIGNSDAGEVLELLQRVIPHDNVYGVRGYSRDYVKPVILHALGIVEDVHGAEFVLRDSEGQLITRYVSSNSSAEVQGEWLALPAPENTPLYLTRSEDVHYGYTYLESSRTLYFQYNVCNEMPGTLFVDFLEEMFSFMRAHPTDRFVVDLRRNSGGQLENASLFLVQLMQYPEFRESGRLFVLTSNRTYSSAVYLASVLRKMGASLIGEPTAQGPNFYMSPREFTLPNSGLRGYYSAVYLETVEETASTIEPDLWIELSANDYFNGNDPILWAALNF